MRGIRRSPIQATTSVTPNSRREQGTLLRWCGKDRSGKFGTKVAGSAMQLIGFWSAFPGVSFLKSSRVISNLYNSNMYFMLFLHVFTPSRTIN